jgi:chromate transporter
MGKLTELAGLFVKLGTIGFGGPAVHIGLLEEEVVKRRGWLSRQQFLDLVGVTHLIPGPNSTEMAIHVGYRRAGWRGLIVAGTAFILPATLISTLLAWSYVQYGSLPQIEPMLNGIKPAVLAIITAALLRLAKTALKSWPLLLIGGGVVAASWRGQDEVLVFLVGSLLGVLLLRFVERDDDPKATALAAVVAGESLRPASAVTASAAAASLGPAALASAPLWKLGLFFLKIGAVLYGGGYVLVAYLEGGLVRDYGWLTQAQLVDAIAVGQFTPGPILSTATFIGYLLAGIPGAAVATVAVFLPSFLFVVAVNPLIPALRRSRWASRFLDSVNAASIGLMAAVTVSLGQKMLIDWRAWLLALSATAVGLRWKLTPAWLVLAGGLLGWLLYR